MTKPALLSVCIPCYSMGGDGARYLRHSLDILRRQDFQDFEVVVTDQSDDGSIAELCAEFTEIDLRHIRTRDLQRLGSANTNAAMDAARGEVVKVLFQDDFLNGSDALGQIAAAFQDPAVKWCLTGCAHTFDGHTLTRFHIPRYHRRIVFGKNTVSSPSVLAVRRAVAPRFDENLIWLMDVDYYHRCNAALGAPTLINPPLVVNRLHDGQVSAGVRPDLVRSELRYVRAKYRDQLSWSDWLHYVDRLRKTWV